MADAERRRYFRIDETVGLAYRLAEDNSHGEHAQPAEHIHMTTNQILKTIDNELHGFVNTIWREDPVLAKALGLISKKMDIIASELEFALNPMGPTTMEDEEMVVNLSGCGIAFNCDQQFERNALLELFITLNPSTTAIALAGTVINCRNMAQDTGVFRIQVDFTEIESDEQERLIQHVVQRQVEQSAAIESRDSQH